MNSPCEQERKTKNKTSSVLGVLLGVVATVPNWTAAAVLSLLGLAGGTAASVAGWLSPILAGVTAMLLGRAHYVLYVLKRGNRASVVITWLATVLVVGFWAWRWIK